MLRGDVHASELPRQWAFPVVLCSTRHQPRSRAGWAMNLILAVTATLAVLLINEAAVAGNPELNLIPRHHTLESTCVEGRYIGIAKIRGDVRYRFPAKERKVRTVLFQANTENEAGLIRSAVVRGAVIDTADEVERRIEWKLAQRCSPSFCSRRVHVVCSVNGFDASIPGRPDFLCQDLEAFWGISVNVLGLIGKEYQTWCDERAFRFLANGCHGLIWTPGRVAHQQLAGDRHILCW